MNVSYPPPPIHSRSYLGILIMRLFAGSKLYKQQIIDHSREIVTLNKGNKIKCNLNEVSKNRNCNQKRQGLSPVESWKIQYQRSITAIWCRQCPGKQVLWEANGNWTDRLTDTSLSDRIISQGLVLLNLNTLFAPMWGQEPRVLGDSHVWETPQQHTPFTSHNCNNSGPRSTVKILHITTIVLCGNYKAGMYLY